MLKQLNEGDDIKPYLLKQLKGMHATVIENFNETKKKDENSMKYLGFKVIEDLKNEDLKLRRI